MTKPMKKLLSLLFVLVMVACVFTACQKNDDDDDDDDRDDERIEEVEEEEKFEVDYPKTDWDDEEIVRLTVGIPQSATVTDYDMNALTVYLEDNFGLEIEWTYFASKSDEYMQQLALMCSANEELPDVLLGFNGLKQESFSAYCEDGYFMDLTEWIEEAPYYNEALEELPKEVQEVIEKSIISPDRKKLYAMPLVKYELPDVLQSQAYINKTWLNNVGMSVPTTVQELEAVCQAFATQDPNQNGQKDEIPMMKSDEMYAWIMNAYLPYEITRGEDAIMDIYASEFNAASSYINSLSDKQLYVSAYSGTKDTVGIFCGDPGNVTGAMTDTLKDYVALDSLSAATNEGGKTVIFPAKVSVGGIITKDCENMDGAMRLLDAFYLDATVMRMRYGEEDVDWIYEKGRNSCGTTSFVKMINTEAFYSGNSTYARDLAGICTPENYLAVDGSGGGRGTQMSRLQAEQWAIITSKRK